MFLRQVMAQDALHVMAALTQRKHTIRTLADRMGWTRWRARRWVYSIDKVVPVSSEAAPNDVMFQKNQLDPEWFWIEKRDLRRVFGL